MSFVKPAPPIIDPQILAIASLTDLPSQPVNMTPVNSILGKQVQQVKTVVSPPTVNPTFPVYVSKIPLSSATAQVRVQFIQPSNPNYRQTQISLRTAQGTLTLGGAGGRGPIVFTAPQGSTPTSVLVQQSNATGASSGTDLGQGSGRALNLLPSQ